jgi:hypothetical protein
LDIEERPRCYEVYDQFIVQSIEQPVSISADLIISITLLEHVRDNTAAVQTIYEALTPSGTTLHYIPSKWHPYSIILRLVGPKLQKLLIGTLRSHAVETTGYPTFFDKCSPDAMRRLFECSGFGNIRIKPFYRAGEYFAFFLPAYTTVCFLENVAEFLGWRFFCSGFIISATKNQIPPYVSVAPTRPTE